MPPTLFEQGFDSAGIGDGDDGSEEAADRLVSSLSDERIDDELSEAEKRLAKAAYYKAIVVNGVVEDDGTENASEVNEEARLWGRQQMAKLLGIQRDEAPVQVQSQFSEAEVAVLKKLVERAMNLGVGPAPAPVAKKVELPPAPVAKKAAAQPQPPKPQARRPQAPATAKKPKPKVPPKKGGAVDYDSIPSNEVFTDTDGQQYKFVDNPRFDPDVEGSKPRTKLKVTNQVGSPRAIPMPTGDQMSLVTETQARQTIMAGESANTIFPDAKHGVDVFAAGAVAGLREG